jgi:hypothetical protein
MNSLMIFDSPAAAAAGVFYVFARVLCSAESYRARAHTHRYKKQPGLSALSVDLAARTGKIQ